MAIAVSAFFLAAPFVAFSSEGRESAVPAERKKNILIVGKNDRKAYLGQVLLGAEEVSKKNEAAVTVYTGKSNAEEISMQALFNYASYLNADGIIACIEDDDERLDIPKKTNGDSIPLVTIGSYAPNLPQLSYIGANYSELGKITAREIIEQIGPSGKVILLESNAASDTNHSNLMAGLLGALSAHPEISVKTLQFERESSFSKEDSLRQQLASQEDLELIVSLAEQTTILAAQSVRDLNLSGKVKIIGFGDSDDCRADFEKKIVTELISVKTQDIGRRAMTELFEYIRYGYANNYITTDVKVRRSGE